MSTRQGDNLKDIAAKRNTRDLICLSHLRWNFVFQRPQHLMTRFARTRRVFFFEEPIFRPCATAELRITRDQRRVRLRTASAVGSDATEGIANEMRRLLNELHSTHSIERPVVWYYTPMALEFARHLVRERHRVRLHGRAVGFQGCPAGTSRERGRAAEPRRSGLYGRPESVRSEARASSSGLRVSEQRRCAALRLALRHRAAEPEDQAPHPAPAAGLLRRHR